MGVITGLVRETISGIPDLEKRLDLGAELVLALYLVPHKVELNFSWLFIGWEWMV